MQTTTAKQWSALLVLTFLGVVVILTFHLYTRRPEKPSAPSTEMATIEVPVVTVVNPVIGSKNAQVTIVEFGDYQCEPCRTLATTLSSILQEFPNDVRLIWKDFPNENLHAESTNAAIAARCAQEVDRFWEYHDLLYTQSQLLGESTYRAIAKTLGLDDARFANCLSSRTTLPRVQRDYEEGLALSLTATPTLFVNGERLVGAITVEDLRALIEKILVK